MNWKYFGLLIVAIIVLGGCGGQTPTPTATSTTTPSLTAEPGIL